MLPMQIDFFFWMVPSFIAVRLYLKSIRIVPYVSTFRLVHDYSRSKLWKKVHSNNTSPAHFLSCACIIESNFYVILLCYCCWFKCKCRALFSPNHIYKYMKPNCWYLTQCLRLQFFSCCRFHSFLSVTNSSSLHCRTYQMGFS